MTLHQEFVTRLVPDIDLSVVGNFHEQSGIVFRIFHRDDCDYQQFEVIGVHHASHNTEVSYLLEEATGQMVVQNDHVLMPSVACQVQVKHCEACRNMEGNDYLLDEEVTY